MLPGVNIVIAAYRHGSNERNCAYSNNNRHHNSTPKRTPVTNTNIYQDVSARNAIGCRVIIVTAPVAERDQATALSRIRSDTPIADRTHTHNKRDRYATGDRHHCHSISSHSATNQPCSLERQRHAATSDSPMTATRPPIYKSGSCRMSRRHCHSARRESRPSNCALSNNERHPTARTLPQYIRADVV